MVVILFFALISGIVTILSPCILPVLPIILAGSVGNNTSKSKPWGIITGFILSFTIFTLFLSAIVKVLGLSHDFLRNMAVFIVIAMGLSYIFPEAKTFLEKLLSRFTGNLQVNNQNSTFSFYNGLLIGISLGLLWSPCVGPILASVIALSLTGSVNITSVLTVLFYAIGTAIPMILIMNNGRGFITRNKYLSQNLEHIQLIFGYVMVATGLIIATNTDRMFTTFILSKFPNYGTGLTKIEDNQTIKKFLGNLNKSNKSDLDLSAQDQTQEESFEARNLPKLALAPELLPSGEWFNSQPLQLKNLRGKVVLIDFWTYSCINCQRTLPFIRSWWDKYGAESEFSKINKTNLVIIGVHSPEFEFEKEPDNVAKAIKDFGLKYPIFQDNNFFTWRAYQNQYWPAKYLIDKDGYIRYYHFGEGNYQETEKAIVSLLKETGASTSQQLTEMQYDVQAGTPETYVGFYRSNALSSPETVADDKFKNYTLPNKIPENKYALNGEWLVSGEYALSKQNSELVINFDATKVFLVMRPHESNKSFKVKIFVDDKMQFFGEDVKDGIVTIDSARLYELVRLNSRGRHILKIQFIEGNVEVFAFTFG